LPLRRCRYAPMPVREFAMLTHAGSLTFRLRTAKRGWTPNNGGEPVGIEIVWESPDDCPRVHCDVCHEPILDADGGLALYSDDTRRSRKRSPVTFVHKVECREKYLDRPRSKSAIVLEQDLWIFLLKLANRSFASRPSAHSRPIVSLTDHHPMKTSKSRPIW
jgi:hypothetical protein